jgi:hypothetical protein
VVGGGVLGQGHGLTLVQAGARLGLGGSMRLRARAGGGTGCGRGGEATTKVGIDAVRSDSHGRWLRKP